MRSHPPANENRHLERQRHPCASGPAARLAGRRATRRRLSAGDQGLARPAALRPARHGALLDVTGTASKGYSGVALLVAKIARRRCRRSVRIPAFDFEQRIACATVDLAGRRRDGRLGLCAQRRQGLRREAALPARRSRRWVGEAQTTGRPLIICGDLNVARTERDIHPKERKPNQIGARPDERAMIEQIARPRPGRRRPRARSGQRRPVHLVGAVAQPEAAQHRLAHRLRAGVERARRSAPQSASFSARSAPAITARW